ncbi:MAG: tetratricopeptide repeat protein [Caldilineaceae bacterium]|nr:tetratricopeptide repeat protein [Caldilineaceae bacterium]
MMHSRLQLQLFGGLQIRQNEEIVTELVSRKADALLAYVACTQRVHAREILADFLWENRSQTQAAGNLRVVLNSLRANLSPFVAITRHTVALKRESDVWVDVLAFEQYVRPLSERNAATGALAATLVEALEKAAALYQGEFLDGFFLRQAPLFDEWARIERERLHILAVNALQALAAHYLAVAQYAAGINVVERWLHLDLLNENAHRMLLLLLAHDGNRSAAIQHFERMAALFRHELGSEPSPETEALYHQLLDDTAPLVAAPHEPTRNTPVVVNSPNNLDAALSPIVGRDQELVQIVERLQLPACRLLTLVGIGGVGKTRLALEAASLLSTSTAGYTLFSDGIFWVHLAQVESETQLLAAIAQAAHYSFQGTTPPVRQLLDFLRHRRLLLVLDNVEQLLGHTHLLLQILQGAPSVKLLVTSRERLDFQGEWLLTVGGLAYPITADGQAWHTYPATQLFIQCATALVADFAIQPQRVEIVQICRILEGLPLGIQLAAASVRAFTCRQIVAAIEQNLDFLASTMRNLPTRHRSLRAIFEYSWQLLAPAEKEAFARLAIFEGSFTASAALRVAGISGVVLLTLIDKSLLSVVPGEVMTTEAERRYRMHPVVHQYAMEKLTAAASADGELVRRHAHYYATIVHEQAAFLVTAQAAQALNALTLDLENVRKSWQTAVALALLDSLTLYLPGLIQYYRLRGLFQEGQTLVAKALEALRLPAGASDTHPLRDLLSQLAAYQAALLIERGYYEEATQVAITAVALASSPEQTSQPRRNEALSRLQWGIALHRQADYRASDEQLTQVLALVDDTSAPQIRADAHFYLGRNRLYVGDYTGGRLRHEQALALYRTHGDLVNELAAHNSLAMLHLFAGEYAKAKAAYERCLHDYQLIGNRPAIGLILNNLGALATLVGRYDEARRYYEESLSIRRSAGGRQSEALILANLAITWHQTNEQSKALDYAQVALQLSIELGERDTEAYARLCLGHVLAAGGRWHEATTAYQVALSNRRQAGQMTQALEPLAGLAQVALAQQQLSQAKAYVDEIVPQLGFQTYAGIVELIRIYLTCYQVLVAVQDERATTVLEMGYTILQKRAAAIEEESIRHSYLQIPTHAALRLAYAQRPA